MEYFLFSYPNCTDCQEIKSRLEKTDFRVQEYSLILKESKLKIREFLPHIKRDDKGAIILPSLVLQEEGDVVAVLNNRLELEEWLKSRA
jgi:glutaredoxin